MTPKPAPKPIDIKTAKPANSEPASESSSAPSVTSTPEPEKPKAQKEEGEKKPFTITLDAKLLRTLTIVARAEGVSVTDVIVSAILAGESGIKARAKKALEALVADLSDE